MSTPLVTAHRGSMATHPENTISAFRFAERVGADELELDVQLSRDNVPVVCHDEMLDRTTNGRGAVAERSAAELAELDAGDGHGVPTVAAVLRSTRLPIQIEIKTPAAARPLAQQVIPAAHAERRVQFISLHREALAECRKVAPQVPCGLVVARDVDSAADRGRKFGAALLCVAWPLITPQLVVQAHDLGMRVAAYVVDTRTVERAISLGLDSVTTNNPAALRPLVDAAR